jgi:uroporphyrinogen decarboxylase
MQKPLLSALKGNQPKRTPIWFMRQAGRYLPEYRKVRASAGSFLDLCFTPDLAIEVTLQPIRRFALDAAILFSDILVIPHALGQKLWFEEGRGPRLEALQGPKDLPRLSSSLTEERLAPVYETLNGVRSALPESTTLIGFAGAPWTVASYMVEGGSSNGFPVAKGWAYRDPDSFARLIALLVDVTSDYLIRQVESGAEVLQIFDSWAGVWPAAQMRRWCLEPAREIVARVKHAHPEVPIILFPRGAGPFYVEFAETSGADALGLDTTVPLEWAHGKLQSRVAVQGNLDPVLLLSGGPLLHQSVTSILEILGEGPFVFNLGHGILPETPISHVEDVLEIVRS